MRRFDPRVAHLPDLRVPFLLHLAQRQAPLGNPQQEILRPALKFTRVVRQTRHQFPRRGRRSIAQIQMHTHAEPRRSSRQLHSRPKRSAIRQQRRASHNAVAMRLRDSRVHSLGPSQIIRIDDQIFHGLPATRPLSCPSGQLHIRTRRSFCTIDPLVLQL
jgi:hypothetical protein